MRRPLLPATCAYLLGLLVAGRVGWDPSDVAVCALPAVAGLWIASRRSRSLGAACVLLAAAGALGWVRSGSVPEPASPGESRLVRCEVRVIHTPGPPRPRDDEPSQRTTVVSVEDAANSRALLRLDLVPGQSPPPFRAGELWSVAGRLEPLRSPTNPGPRDRRPLRARAGIGSLLLVPDPGAVRRLDGPSGDWAARLQWAVRDRLRRAAGERPGRLLGSLLLGVREDLEPDTADAFRSSGLAHLLAVSGLHVMFLASAVSRLLRVLLPDRVPAPLRALVLPILLLGYCCLCRFSTPVVRASVFVAGLDVGAHLGRRVRFADRLAPAVFLLLLADPGELHDPGFQLSFSAVLAIVHLREPLREALCPALDTWRRFPELISPRRLVWTERATGAGATALAAQLGTMPAAIHWFGTLHPWALPANLVAVPIASVLVPTAGALALLGGSVPGLTRPLAAAGAASLEGVAGFVGGLPYADATVNSPGAGWLVVAGVALLFAGLGRLSRARVWSGVVVAVAAMVLPGLIDRSGRPAIHVLDVGHGVAVLIQDGAGRDVLIDAGGRTPWATERRLLPALRALGVGELSAVWLSHGDHDHCSGLAGVLARHGARQIVVPVGFDSSDAVEGVIERARERGARLRRVCRGDTVRHGRVELRVLHPPLDDRRRSRNEASIVVVATLHAGDGPRVAVLPGDVDGVDAWSLASGSELPRADLLLLPHHGRGSARLHRAWIDVVRPRRHVACAADDRFVAVETWITGRDGALTLSGDGTFRRTRELPRR